MSERKPLALPAVRCDAHWDREAVALVQEWWRCRQCLAKLKGTKR